MENLYRPKNKPKVTEVQKVEKETPKIKTITAKSPKIAEKTNPGQFIMVWSIGEDEVPMAVSKTRKENLISITVEKIGKATKKLHNLEKGDLIGFRGPYGNGFDLTDEKILIIGGGCGMAPMAPTAEEAVEKGKDVTVIISSDSEENLLFRNRMENLDAELLIGTEDGSAGVKGLAPDVIEKAISDKEYDVCLACGPEKMMKAVAEKITETDISLQLSLNRYMKCGIGICGSCGLDPEGLRVCEEGPVFDYEEIKDSEFGEYKRDGCGCKENI